MTALLAVDENSQEDILNIHSGTLSLDWILNSKSWKVQLYIPRGNIL